jgi:putative NADPH-quinone reductase
MEGLLTHSKALVLSTAGGPEEYYKSFGYFDAHMKIANGFFNPSGIDNVEFTCFYAVPAVADEERKKYLETAYHLGKEF